MPVKYMNKIQNTCQPLFCLTALLLTATLTASAPQVTSTSPGNGYTRVATSTNAWNNIVTGRVVSATFDQLIDPSTLTTFTLKENVSQIQVLGIVTINAANTVASFTPLSALKNGTVYTATLPTSVKTATGIPIAQPVTWSFTTSVQPFTA